MTRRCELTGKLPMSGQLRSHAENKTKRTFRPNLCEVTLISDALQRKVRLRISAHALKTVERTGGLDAFLMKARTRSCPSAARSSSATSRRPRASRRQREAPAYAFQRVPIFRSIRTSVRSAPHKRALFVSVTWKPARS